MSSAVFIETERLFEEEGVLAGEILSSSGTLLFPAGLDLESLRAAHPDAIEQLKRHGIEKVLVKKHEPITEEEFRRLISNLSPPVVRMNPLLARVLAHQMSVIYTNASNREVRERGIRSLYSIGEHLSSEVRRIPQITLSLGEDAERKFEEVLHGVNVAVLAGFIAKKLFPSWPELAKSVTIGALFHDIGKAFISPAGGGLDRADGAYRAHPLLGEALLRDSGIRNHDILSFVRSHHE
ncbi:MAG: HD domain-containing protein, partial [Synergistota bacterium]|nr:HD domain-containing protein [Synergistota bacterium]